MADQPKAPSAIKGYFRISESAKASLFFLLPLIIAYEVGTWYYTFDPASHTEQRIVAFTMLRDSLAALGATAYWVAPASVISILLGLIITRRERVKVTMPVVLCMFTESALLAMPLIIMSMLSTRLPMLANGEAFSAGVVLSIGAGIYEELIFRLIGFAVLHFLLVDFLSIRAKIAIPLMVAFSAIGFSLYHYWGSEHFAVQTFVFRSVAGAYFGLLMCFRGFGITAGTHASYDIIICALRATSHVGN